MLATILLAIAVAAISAGFVLGLQTWEFRRFMRSRMRERRDGHSDQRVAIISPVKGADEGIEENLRALFQQDHDNYEIIFVVENARDPAYPVIQQLRDELPHVPCSLVFAGKATESGQKVHNLIAATESLADEVEVLAFVDADSRPPSRWLKTLVARITYRGNGAATGYQWFVPGRSSLSNSLMSSMFAVACSLLGKHRYNLISGSSWAISRELFDSRGLRDAWRGTLSDDLIASQVVREAGLRIEFEPSCLCPSTGDVAFGQMVEFVRRQFLILKRYAPKHWRSSLILSTVMQVGFWGNLVAAIVMLALGQPFGIIHLLASTTLFGMSVARAWIRQDAARRRFPEHGEALSKAGRFDVWGGIFASSLSWLILVSSAFGSTIRWRGNRYRIHRDGTIETLVETERAPLPAEFPSASRYKHAA